MRRYDLWFLILAAACLIVGVVMGIAMGVVHDFRLGPVHAHLNLLGWASLALFGLTYRAYPALGASRIAGFHFAAAALGAVTLPAGITLSILAENPGLAIAASFVWLAAALLFLANLVAMALSGARSPQGVSSPAAA
ncbi:hypothetical protein [Salinarimonas soli]|uniref:Cytochrome-c oxidase n=1 Tax=Salinarimonas soli TaxID=1638099 RepID=A0A5B2VVZ8_9HYPH|nr:hypothetical protein [Salinarimonas soli]KAA2242209.1 hypothetical protein F0L46_02660 [Salinarimonas soli]